jgi:hypothetical protein
VDSNQRAVLDFDGYADRIPADAKVTEAGLSLWNASATGTGASFSAHKLTKDFDESATWNSPWTRAPALIRFVWVLLVAQML